jgi:hypothetical protein
MSVVPTEIKVEPAGGADRYKPVTEKGPLWDRTTKNPGFNSLTHKLTNSPWNIGLDGQTLPLDGFGRGNQGEIQRDITILANQTAVNDNLTAGTTKVLEELASIKELVDPEKMAQTAKVAAAKVETTAAKAETALKQIESAAEVSAASAPLMAKLEAMQAMLQASEARQQAMEVRQQAMEVKLTEVSQACCVVM